jgi:hypothetical protein
MPLSVGASHPIATASNDKKPARSRLFERVAEQAYASTGL